MNKKRIVTAMASVLLAAPFLRPMEVDASQRLNELQQQEQQLRKESQKVSGEIQSREEKMAALEKEKAQLEKEVTALQADIDTLVVEISEQEKEIQRIKEEIERLQEEIAQLQKQIDSRNEQLESQARSVQTNASASDIIDLLMSAESLSDLVGRINVVNKLVTANQEIMDAQIADQNALEENEKQVKAEQEEMEKVKAQLEISRNNLVNQRLELDDKIVQIAEKYEMTAEERDSFINEQAILAERTSTLNEEMKAEKQRIIEEERARQEAIRIAQEKAQREAEAKAKAEAAARAKAEAAAAANKKEEATTSSNSSSNASSNSSSNASSNSGWLRPANGRYTSHFGYRVHPVTGRRSFHNGTDIAGGGPIRASRAGTVKSASYSGTYGYRVIIDHGDGYETLYAHMQPNLSVAPGQRVSQGQQLGIMGTTGRSTGVHLHFIVYKNGTPVNAMNYIR
ncbi:Murein DD-endopeptidase MepM and murein hydrolase activator NlpD, contain LysM domain [Alkalibacterium subtropicum]|uniref:Murein DD-endopeptidase MepM and murein hydrolase activator NlpD, contain LysM domain n=1 Tax=Alkalibacterium subtropicum TaxID=753702 RepID=A0A1I1GTY3_9LACT|nr:peptidoglycan DD-metalloendopeptidase family protein [Alkalibacterium subtropicum]SFC15247.1 Murein DD-endopeptidase MepM and murein hydrolase activator NlpD, contain LysM domain [Alkalibacterium subtropicum]